ncbi:hypothetical protein FH603_5943 [Spirosoma sp. LMG 31447]|uniref:Mobilization protein n=2 Tax=Spirosoma utsteinense TaxID=2585773 RepID=A0ABR6WFS1_9BACT|nr:hypothetical protein [Spirosoma utsteinense]
MENYASNFCNSKGENRDLNSKDLVWYAKIEHERKHGFDSPEVKAGLAESGDLKEGDQRHIHIVVSRCQARENRHVIGVEQQQQKERTTQLSPTVNNQKMFDRDAFYRSNEQSFDNRFDYVRNREESYDYCNTLKNGTRQVYDQAIKRDQIERSKEQNLEKSQRLGMSF